VSFLTVYTPTYKRPHMLELCKTSVANQTVPVEHVIVPDEVGLGIGGMYQDIRNHTGQVHGDYVMVLSDDNILVDQNFAGDLQDLVVGFDEQPDVVVFKGQTGGTVQPAHWGEPVLTMIDLSCFAVIRDLWVEYADRWGDRYEGDFDFIRALWDDGHLFAWWPRLVFQALQISQGRPE
jgi:hypothetical protein